MMFLKNDAVESQMPTATLLEYFNLCNKSNPGRWVNFLVDW